MVKFTCYICDEKFGEQKTIISHLKYKHRIVENVDKIKCIYNFEVCRKDYFSFGAMRKHLKICTETMQQVRKEIKK